MKIWEQITKKIEKKDLIYWLIILGWTFFGMLVVHYISPESQILSRMGTLVSIILAIVAIFYAIVQGVTSQQNIGTMHSIMDNVNRSSKTLEATTQELLDQASGIQKTQSKVDEHVQKLMERREQAVDTPDSVSTESVPDSELNIDVEHTSPLGLVVLYWIVKSFHSDKASSWRILCENYLRNTDDYVHGFVLGLQAGTRGVVRVFEKKDGRLDLRDDISDVSDLETRIIAEINMREEKYAKEEEPVMVGYLIDNKKVIDSYFTSEDMEVETK